MTDSQNYYSNALSQEDEEEDPEEEIELLNTGQC